MDEDRRSEYAIFNDNLYVQLEDWKKRVRLISYIDVAIAALLLAIVIFYQVEGILLIGFIGLMGSGVTGIIAFGTRLNMLINLMDCVVINAMLFLSLVMIVTSHSIDQHSTQFSYPNVV